MSLSNCNISRIVSYKAEISYLDTEYSFITFAQFQTSSQSICATGRLKKELSIHYLD